MPVLPDDGSRMVCPGVSSPSFSAPSIIDLAMRSFTDPNGFWLSSLAIRRTDGLGLRRLTSTSGVLPIMSSTLSLITSSTSAGPHDRRNPDRTRRKSYPSDDGDRLFSDVAVDDAIGARLGCFTFQTDDQ